MTATALRARPSRTAAPAGLARLLWIEIKRNPVPWVLPLLAVLFFLDTYRTTAGYPPVWTVRASAVPDRLLTDFAPFAGGLPAWAGTREGRRKTGDLLASTVRPAWARHLAALAGTMFWLVLAFLIAAAVLYVQIARAAIWGGPPLWPVAVGVVALVTICVAGFTAGALFPGRFTAPLAAVAAVVLHIVGTHQVNDPDIPSLHDLLSLGANLPPYDQGVFYHVPLDVPIAQIMFMGGITVAAAGLLTWSSKRTVSVALVLAGIAASVTAYDLTGTAQLTAAGWNIAALHDAAAGRPVPYPPDCSAPAGFAVCVHPAFGTYLPGVAAALAPVAAAANRFAALPPAARHAWLAAHLPALRAGQITSAQLP